MQRPLQITFRGMEHSDAIERRVREEAARLEQFFDRVTGCHVVVEAPHHRHNQGTIYSVRIDLRVPGEELVVNRERRHHPAHEDVYVAIRDAFEAAARQLEDYVRRQRGDVKHHESPVHGTVTHLVPNEGYGFVTTSDGIEVYFHQHSVVGEYATLDVGDEVRLVIAEGEGEAGPQASTIIPVGKHHPLDATP